MRILGLNLSVVGLAHRNSKKMDCVGLGLIRSVDMTKGLFFVLTPIPLSLLQEMDVNCFVTGRIYLPSNFLTVRSLNNF